MLALMNVGADMFRKRADAFLVARPSGQLQLTHIPLPILEELDRPVGSRYHSIHISTEVVPDVCDTVLEAGNLLVVAI
jgi:hypothetical protein